MKAPRRRPVRLQLGGLVDAADGVEAAREAQVRDELRDDLDEERAVHAQVHVALGMGGELGIAAALGGQQAQRHQLAVLQAQALAGVPVAEAVGGQPLVHIASLVVALVVGLAHLLAEDLDLQLVAGTAAILMRDGRGALERQLDVVLAEHVVHQRDELQLAAGALIGDRLVDDLAALDGLDAELERRGFVRTFPKKGAFVCAPPDADAVQEARVRIRALRAAGLKKEDALAVIEEVYGESITGGKND